MNVVQTPPSPAQGIVCASCGAPLAGDQRYCLSCGQPASAVRLAFLDALQSEGAEAFTSAGSHDGYAPTLEQPGVSGWLRRNAGLLGLLALLLMATLIGLLIGHWASQKSTPAHQVLTIQGLSIPAATSQQGVGSSAGGSSSTQPSSSSSTGSSSHQSKASSANASSAKAATKASATPSEAKSSPASEAAEEKEVKEAENKAAPTPVKANSKSLQELQHKTGKSYEQKINEEVNSTQPIEG